MKGNKSPRRRRLPESIKKLHNPINPVYVTREMVRARFLELMKVLRRPVADMIGEVGKWDLEFDAAKGGYVVVQYAKSAPTYPYGQQRRHGDELYAGLSLAIDVARELMKRKKLDEKDKMES